jgi:hypothetical protein
MTRNAPSCSNRFIGSFTALNTVAVRNSPGTYPTPYNTVYLSRHSLFIFGGAYGDKGGTGSFVARVDPQTLQTIWLLRDADRRVASMATAPPHYCYRA